MTEQEQGQQVRWHPIHWSIRAKIVGSFLLMALVLGVVLIVFTYWQITAKAAQTSGEEMVVAGDKAMQAIGERFESSLAELRFLARSPSLIAALDAAAEHHSDAGDNEWQQRIAEEDAAWQSQTAAIKPFQESLRQNAPAQYLRDFQSTFPQQVETFVTNQQGLIVAMTGTPGDYLQADEAWWQETYAQGKGALYVGDVAYDESASTWTVPVGVPVQTADGMVVGVLRGTIDISALLRELAELRFGESGQTMLLDRDGRILYANDPARQMQFASDAITSLATAQRLGWHEQVDFDGRPAIVALAALPGSLAQSVGWLSLLYQDQQEAENSSFQDSVQIVIGAVGLVVILVVITGFLVANMIARPLRLSTAQARRLAMGDVEAFEDAQTAAVESYARSGDETGALLRAFVDLRAYVKEMAVKAELIAAGDLRVTVQPRSQSDRLGQSFARMVGNLSTRSVGTGADQRRAGGHRQSADPDGGRSV